MGEQVYHVNSAGKESLPVLPYLEQGTMRITGYLHPAIAQFHNSFHQ